MSININTFIFDCFGVLCSPVLNGWYQAYSAKHDFIDDNLQVVFQQFDLGLLSEDDILDYFSQYPGVTLDKTKLREEIDSYLTLDEDLVAIIRKLKQKGFKVLLLSNANKAFFERKIYAEYPEFRDLFSEAVISSEVGMVKPGAEIYQYTLSLAQSRPEESLFIDDSRPNVDAALALGIHGFVYTDSTSFAEHLKSVGVDLID
jgi:putative hydrolase of the HAD superfamily